MTEQTTTPTALDTLTGYARTLAAAGFEVWLTPTGYREAGFLTYRDPSNGCWGTFQHSYHDGWQHLMPLVPSRENGSSMFIGRAWPDAWSVDAARQCAQPTNHNGVVGTLPNVGARGAWLSSNAVRITV